MSQIQCSFVLHLGNDDKIIHSCAVPNLPNQGDIVGLQGIISRPYAGALGRVKNVTLIVDISENDYTYGVNLELIDTTPITVAYEIIRRL